MIVRTASAVFFFVLHIIYMYRNYIDCNTHDIHIITYVEAILIVIHIIYI